MKQEEICQDCMFWGACNVILQNQEIQDGTCQDKATQTTYNTNVLLRRLSILVTGCRRETFDCPECPCGECEREINEIKAKIGGIT